MITALKLILVGMLSIRLISAVVAFSVKAIRRVRRLRMLRQVAHNLKMRFAPEGWREIDCELGDFTLMLAGHSHQASNLIYGKIADHQAHYFDFNYDAGHGALKERRAFSVLTVELKQPNHANFAMWPTSDANQIPVQADFSVRRIKNWLAPGDMPQEYAFELADFLARSFKTDDIHTGFEVRNSKLMLFSAKMLQSSDQIANWVKIGLELAQKTVPDHKSGKICN